MIDFSCIETNIFIGTAPQNDLDVARLTKMNVSAVLSLQSDHDLKMHRIDWKKLQSMYHYNDITVQRYQINDFDEADLAKNLTSPIKALKNLLDVEHTAYVHCNAGVCRAPATVLGYLCHYRGVSLQEGLDYIRASRPQANPYISAVSRALEQLAQEEPSQDC